MKSIKKYAVALLVMAAAIGMMGCKTAVHEHTFSEDWEKDAGHHWHKATCEHTEEVSDSASHNWDNKDCQYDSESGQDKRTCTVCGYVDVKDHVHGSAVTWTKTATTHSGTYDCCGAVKTAEEAHGWDHEDYQYDSESKMEIRTCTVCGYVDVKDHVHGSATTWTKTATTHRETYDCCGAVKTAEAAHGWDHKDYQYDSESKMEIRTCTVCGYVDVKDHVHGSATIPEGFVEVAGGKVTGADNTDNYKGVFPAGRNVTLSSFIMGKYEVTQAQYKAVMAGQKVTVGGTEYVLADSPSSCTGSNSDCKVDWGEDHSNHPVENVTWYDAVYYCNALSAKEKLEPCYTITVTKVDSGHIRAATVEYDSTKDGYRLPTEAEWEYAARGGDPEQDDWNYTFSGADKAKDTSYMSYSNTGLDSVGWYNYNNITGITGASAVTSSREGWGTHEVGKKAANRLDIHDMSGNVWEWCWDWWAYDVGTGDVTDPVGNPSGSNRVFRGGSWYDYAFDASVSYRGSDYPDGFKRSIGFRVCRSRSK